MSKYAANTDVPADKSRSEIERTLSRYGATRFMYGWEPDAAIVQFEADNRTVRFILPMPDRGDRQFTHTPAKGQKRDAAAIEKAYDQAVRQKWRALALVIKAKLEAVESGITEFESEFLANIVLPDDQTVGEHMRPQIAAAYEGGGMPKLLPVFRPKPVDGS